MLDFLKNRETKNMRHIYLSVNPVLAPDVRRNYSPEAFFHSYRGLAEVDPNYVRLMERAGHNVITCKTRFDYESMGGPRKISGVYVDQALTPVPKSEVY